MIGRNLIDSQTKTARCPVEELCIDSTQVAGKGTVLFAAIGLFIRKVRCFYGGIVMYMS